MSFVTLTAQIERFTNGVRPHRAELRINTPHVKDVDGNVLHAGGYQVIYFNRGKISVDLLATNTPNTDPETWQYGFQVAWSNGSLPKFYADLTEDTDLSELQPMDPADPVYLPAEISMNRVTGLDEALDAQAEELSDLEAVVSTKANASALTAKADASALTQEVSDRELADSALQDQVDSLDSAINNDMATFVESTTNSLAYLDASKKAVTDASSPAVIGAIGASITSNGSLSYYDRALSGSISLGDIAYFTYALPLTQGKFCFGGIAATPGYTSQQIMDTHLPSALASNWDYVLIGEMSNDYGNGVAVTDTKNRVISMVAQIKAAGKTPILTTLPPDSTESTDAALYTWMTKYNAWLKNFANAQRLPYVDYATVMSNPADGTPVAGYTSDGKHPTNTGARVMGEELARVLNTIPLPAKQPLAGAYNPNLMIPDVVRSSAGSDKAVGTGNTTGGWGLKAATHSKYWKGSAGIVNRGSAGDYSLRFPVDPSKWVAGHRVRLSFALDVSNVPAGGTWSAYLYNLTQLQVIAGFTSISTPMTNNSLTVLDAAVTSGSNAVTSASKLFRPEHVGHAATANVGVVTSIPAGTTVIGVSADGGTAYLSANAATTQATAVFTLSGKPVVPVFEFTVQSDMVGDDIRFYYTAGGATGVTLMAHQITLVDLTALGAV